MFRIAWILALQLTFVPAISAQQMSGFSGRVVAADGTPIKSARITFPDYEAKPAIAQTTTDNDGHFVLSIPSSDERVIHRSSMPLSIEATGFAATYVDPRHLTTFPQAIKSLGEITLDAGRVYSGRILDAAGRPILGAEIKCSAGRHELGHTVNPIGPEMSVTTNSEGRFQTPQLPLGMPRLYVNANGFRLGFYSKSDFSSVGQDGTLPDLRLTPDKPIYGVVKNELGEPVKNLRVEASGIFATTDPDGVFVLRGLTGVETLQLQAYQEGYAFVNWSVLLTPNGFEHYDIARAAEINSDDAETHERALAAITTKARRLEIKLKPEAHIRGHVVDAETGEPITVSQIVLCTFTRSPDGEVTLDGCRSTRFSQPQPGEFSLGYTYPTEYHLTVSAEGYQDAEAFTPPTKTLQNIDGIIVKMQRRDSSADRIVGLGQQLFGTVKDRDAFPDGTRVALWSLPRPSNAVNAYIIRGRTTVGDGYVRDSTTIRGGSFTLNVPYQSDDWYVIAETPQRVVSLEGPIPVAKGAATSVELSPRKAGKLRGHVTDHSSAGVPLYAILFSDVGIQYETRVALDGSFVFHDVYPGTYGLKIGCDSILDTEVPVLSSHSMTSEDRFEIHRKPSQPWLRAMRVVIAEGQSSENVNVEFEP